MYVIIKSIKDTYALHAKRELSIEIDKNHCVKPLLVVENLIARDRKNIKKLKILL